MTGGRHAKNRFYAVTDVVVQCMDLRPSPHSPLIPLIARTFHATSHKLASHVSHSNETGEPSLINYTPRAGISMFEFMFWLLWKQKP